jgi:hypothetical protein
MARPLPKALFVLSDPLFFLRALAFPPPSVDLADIRRKYHAALKEEKDNKKKG